MKKILFLLVGLLLITNFGIAQTDFNISIERYKLVNGLIYGKISVNGSLIGNCYENDDLKVPAENYNGIMRYNSGKGFVQNPFGGLGMEGDFLLEVSGVPGRTNILFHSGNKPEHSKGCILLGPVNKDISGSAFLDENHPLRKLRVLFYGSETPNYCPDKKINIEIIDNYQKNYNNNTKEEAIEFINKLLNEYSDKKLSMDGVVSLSGSNFIYKFKDEDEVCDVTVTIDLSNVTLNEGEGVVFYSKDNGIKERWLGGPLNGCTNGEEKRESEYLFDASFKSDNQSFIDNNYLRRLRETIQFLIDKAKNVDVNK